MPIYEYRCEACGVQREVLQKMSDAPLKDCPECGKPAMSKMVTAAGFQLKGSGWYATDFKHGPAQKSKAPAESQSKADDAKPAAKADDKPAPPASEKKADAPAAKPAPTASPATSS